MRACMCCRLQTQQSSGWLSFIVLVFKFIFRGSPLPGKDDVRHNNDSRCRQPHLSTLLQSPLRCSVLSAETSTKACFSWSPCLLRFLKDVHAQCLHTRHRLAQIHVSGHRNRTWWGFPLPYAPSHYGHGAAALAPLCAWPPPPSQCTSPAPDVVAAAAATAIVRLDPAAHRTTLATPFDRLSMQSTSSHMQGQHCHGHEACCYRGSECQRNHEELPHCEAQARQQASGGGTAGAGTAPRPRCWACRRRRISRRRCFSHITNSGSNAILGANFHWAHYRCATIAQVHHCAPVVLLHLLCQASVGLFSPLIDLQSWHSTLSYPNLHRERAAAQVPCCIAKGPSDHKCYSGNSIHTCFAECALKCSATACRVRQGTQ
jgi:hypothetical protein